MKYRVLFVACLMTVAWSLPLSAATIPEPDVILYGHACLGGSPASAEDDVTIIAKATVASEVREVGRYKMGDNPAATDCNGDHDCYVLRIRLETVPSGQSPSGTAVVLDRAHPASVQVYLIQGTGPEEQVAELQIADAGIIRRTDLRHPAPTPDINRDESVDLRDYQLFRAVFHGPGVPGPIPCNPADLNGDGSVDLRDFGILQAAFTG